MKLTNLFNLNQNCAFGKFSEITELFTLFFFIHHNSEFIIIEKSLYTHHYLRFIHHNREITITKHHDNREITRKTLNNSSLFSIHIRTQNSLHSSIPLCNTQMHDWDSLTREQKRRTQETKVEEFMTRRRSIERKSSIPILPPRKDSSPVSFLQPPYFKSMIHVCRDSVYLSYFVCTSNLVRLDFDLRLEREIDMSFSSRFWNRYERVKTRERVWSISFICWRFFFFMECIMLDLWPWPESWAPCLNPWTWPNPDLVYDQFVLKDQTCFPHLLQVHTLLPHILFIFLFFYFF